MRVAALSFATVALLLSLVACQKSSDQTSAAAASSASSASGASSAPTDSTSKEDANKPLTEDDIQLYLKVMRAAADRMKALPAADKDLLAKYAAMSKGDNAQLDAMAINHAMELSNLDDTVAKEMKVSGRYGRVKDAIAGLLVACRDCSGDASDAPQRTAEQKKQDAAEAAQQKQQFALIDKHRQEILPLEKTVHPASPQAIAATSPVN